MFFERALTCMQTLLSTAKPDPSGRYADPALESVRRLYEIASRAKLITFSKPAHLIPDLPTIGVRRPDLLDDTFTLPANPVAVEDPGGVTIIEDREEEARGMDSVRFVVEFQPVTPESADNYRDAPSMEKVILDTGNYGAGAMRAVMCEVEQLMNVGIEGVLAGVAMLPIGSLVFTAQRTFEFELIHPLAIRAISENSSTVILPSISELRPFNDITLEALRKNILTAFALLALHREREENRA